jgi:hypothetical protein
MVPSTVDVATKVNHAFLSNDLMSPTSWASTAFGWSRQFEYEGVNAAWLHFIDQGGVDGAMARDFGLTSERIANHCDTKMGFAAGTATDMSSMLCGFVYDFQKDRHKRRRKFTSYFVSCTFGFHLDLPLFML